VQVAQLENGEAVERGWQLGQYDVVTPYLYVFGIFAGTPV